MMANIVSEGAREVGICLPVELRFETREQTSVPRFRLTRANATENRSNEHGTPTQQRSNRGRRRKCIKQCGTVVQEMTAKMRYRHRPFKRTNDTCELAVARNKEVPW